MMDEITQNIVMDAVFDCPDPQIQDYFHQLMLEKDNIFFAFALERTFTKFKEVLFEQLKQNTEIKYVLNDMPVIHAKHKFLEGKDMVKNFDISLNDQLFEQLERLSDATLSNVALQEEIDNASLVCLKTQLQIQIDESMMLIKQIKSTAPWLLSLHPDVEECLRSQCASLTRLMRSLTSSAE